MKLTKNRIKCWLAFGIACLGLFTGHTTAAVIDVLEYGAFGDANTLNTGAFEKAVAACVEQKGGTILVPAGIYRTGPIELKSNIRLRLETGTVLLGSELVADYQVDGRRRPLIWAQNASNMMICGQGIIDGYNFNRDCRNITVQLAITGAIGKAVHAIKIGAGGVNQVRNLPRQGAMSGL